MKQNNDLIKYAENNKFYTNVMFDISEVDIELCIDSLKGLFKKELSELTREFIMGKLTFQFWVNGINPFDLEKFPYIESDIKEKAKQLFPELYNN